MKVLNHSKRYYSIEVIEDMVVEGEWSSYCIVGLTDNSAEVDTGSSSSEPSYKGLFYDTEKISILVEGRQV